jgi:hypothetical protein
LTGLNPQPHPPLFLKLQPGLPGVRWTCITSSCDINWETLINFGIHFIEIGGEIEMAKWILKRVRIPVSRETHSVDLMTREQIEEEFSEIYEWTGREYLLRLVEAVNKFSEKFKGRILGFIVESDESGDVVRITAIALTPKARSLSLIDVEEWLRSRGR